MNLPLKNNAAVSAELARQADRYRLRILEMTIKGNGGHIGGSYSVIDMLTALYHRVMNHDPQNPHWEGRDRLIFSKGHCCLALYNVLAEFGYFPKENLETYYQDGGYLAGHPTYGKIPGAEATAGSLGHGLSIAVGMAIAARHRKQDRRIFTILGDGESNEGSVWEGFAAGGQFGLTNLTAIVDCNGYESLGTVDEIMSIEPLRGRLESFGWAVREIDGHDMDEILSTLESVPFHPSKPSAIISRTNKGNGVSFMENVSKWHYRAPSDDEAEQARREIEARINR
ncbi:MAG: transketolase [Rhodospirillaceae bacterium]|jgi:transketolase|nr:transketolase [Rhodospirillaceae bacterium]